MFHRTLASQQNAGTSLQPSGLHRFESGDISGCRPVTQAPKWLRLESSVCERRPRHRLPFLREICRIICFRGNVCRIADARISPVWPCRKPGAQKIHPSRARVHEKSEPVRSLTHGATAPTGQWQDRTTRCLCGGVTVCDYNFATLRHCAPRKRNPQLGNFRIRWLVAQVERIVVVRRYGYGRPVASWQAATMGRC